MDDILHVWIDEKNQIIRQELSGNFTLERVLELGRKVDEEISKLKDPDYVRILVDTRGLRKADSRARKQLVEYNKLPRLKRVAFWGIRNPIVRAIIGFITIATANNKLKPFAKEEDALAWLLDKKES